ncbi:GapA-binding peptide SR1P [Hazenella sp. IB182357]|uniref:GapA-binding peptide SR1P n=1 Tax=Polycladospora coralii TaxID=2771432 RepID=A0A926N9A9_9BACL|nr:GapA-binding peptide SR1P [Polycladospora coralii]MBD1371275.1 GapA-binding peptide SR1P [Polycladospora coralii]MBS7530230.1 GapA-binding peptide SR1P [Polycladospora coralii]
MEAIVCQSCDQVIEYMYSEKVGTLYGKCVGCDDEEPQEQN